jgi:hypothetical protein
LKPHADAYGVDIPTFAQMYQTGKVINEKLDEYFLHDRAGIVLFY